MIELRTKRVQWASLAVTVREESGLDTFKEPHLFWAIFEAIHGEQIDYQDIPLSERNKIQELTVMISRTTAIEGDLGIVWPKSDSPKECFIEAYHLLDKLPGGFVRLWRSAISEASSVPMGDPELAPPETLGKSKKKSESQAET